jgi:hypothetical protein
VTAAAADTITFSLIGFVVVIAAIVVWRVVVHDPTIRKVRFGVFYERERTDDEDEDEPEEPERGH